MRRGISDPPASRLRKPAGASPSALCVHRGGGDASGHPTVWGFSFSYTPTSQAVSHPRTSQAGPCLAPEINRDGSVRVAWPQPWGFLLLVSRGSVEPQPHAGAPSHVPGGTAPENNGGGSPRVAGNAPARSSSSEAPGRHPRVGGAAGVPGADLRQPPGPPHGRGRRGADRLQGAQLARPAPRTPATRLRAPRAGREPGRGQGCPWGRLGRPVCWEQGERQGGLHGARKVR